MTLEQLFINLVPRYLNKGEGRQVKKDIGDIEEKTQRLNKTLLAAGAAFGVFAKAGLTAAGQWDRTLTALSVKAGTTRNEFSKMYGEMTRALSVETGANRGSLAAGAQQSYSLGGRGAGQRRALRLAGILEAAGVVSAPSVLETAFSLQASGRGTAADILDKATLVAQRNARELSAYFPAITATAPLAQATGVGTDEQLGILGTLSGRVKSMPEAETQLDAFLTGVLKPSDSVRQAFEKRTERDYSEFQAMVRDDFAGAMEYLFEHFQPSEFATITQERTALQFLNNMRTGFDQLVANIRALAGAEGTVDDVAADNAVAYTVASKRFSAAFDGFLTSWGEPFMALMTRIYNGGRRLFDILTRINDTFFGIPGYITALTGGIVALTAGVSLLRTFMASQFLAGMASTITDAFRPAGTPKGSASGDPMTRGLTAATLGATIVAFAQQIWGNITGAYGGGKKIFGYVTKGFRGARGPGTKPTGDTPGMQNLFDSHSPSYMAAATVMGWDPKIKKGTDDDWMFKRPKGHRGLLGTVAVRGIQILIKAVQVLLSPLTAVAAGMATFVGLFTWFTRKTDAGQQGYRRALERSRLRRHLEEGKPMEEAPLPGMLDETEIELEQAVARHNDAITHFFEQSGDALGGFFGNVFISLTNQIEYLGSEIGLELDGFGSAFIRIWQTFITAPIDYIVGLNNRMVAWMHNVEANLWNWLSEKLGFGPSPSAENLEGLNAPSPGQTAIQFIDMSDAEAERLGLTGQIMPKSFDDSDEVDQRRTLLTPTLPTPRIDHLNSINQTEAQRMLEMERKRNAELTVNNTFNINGVTDPQKIAEMIRNQSVNSIFEALENHETPIVR